jgi:uncharacterized membrane protein YtjA (UPF0391 family)
MLRWALLFLVISVIAAILGVWPVAFLAKEIAWVLFVVFLALFLVALVMGRATPPPP